MLQESWTAYTDQKAIIRNTLYGLKMQLQEGIWNGVLSNVPHMAEM
jgi:squalene cyclase